MSDVMFSDYCFECCSFSCDHRGVACVSTVRERGKERYDMMKSQNNGYLDEPVPSNKKLLLLRSFK